MRSAGEVIWRARSSASASSLLLHRPPGQRKLQGPPCGNSPGAFPRLGVVRDAREQTAQFHGSGELPALLEGGADRGGFGLGDGEHERSVDHIVGLFTACRRGSGGIYVSCCTPNHSGLGKPKRINRQRVTHRLVLVPLPFQA